MSDFELPEEAMLQVRRVEELDRRAEAIVEDLEKRLVRIERLANEQRAAVAKDQAMFEALTSNRFDAAELLAEAWAEYETIRGKAVEQKLRIKSRPAKGAAAEVKAKTAELVRLRREAKVREWVTRLYEDQFPWLTELRDLEFERDYIDGAPATEDSKDDDGRDPVCRWLSEEEYRALPSAERSQRALDRYLGSRKSRFEIGRDYERYIGYLREMAGGRVNYQGIFAGLEDLGRDLVVEFADHIEVVQCKCWSQRKTIHEKHIFQHYGTVVALRIEQPEKDVVGTFTTSTSLSERAKDFAEQLDITVEEGVPLADYPRIKCNIARESGDRIYHLPFDQQYDRTQIEPDRGEAWAETCAEAEEMGFRRAKRWTGPGEQPAGKQAARRRRSRSSTSRVRKR